MTKENINFSRQYIVYNPQTIEKIKTVTLKHKSGALYILLEPFEKELIDNGLSAIQTDILCQEHLKGKSFKDKIKCLFY